MTSTQHVLTIPVHPDATVRREDDSIAWGLPPQQEGHLSRLLVTADSAETTALLREIAASLVVTYQDSGSRVLGIGPTTLAELPGVRILAVGMVRGVTMVHHVAATCTGAHALVLRAMLPVGVSFEEGDVLDEICAGTEWQWSGEGAPDPWELDEQTAGAILLSNPRFQPLLRTDGKRDPERPAGAVVPDPEEDPALAAALSEFDDGEGRDILQVRVRSWKGPSELTVTASSPWVLFTAGPPVDALTLGHGEGSFLAGSYVVRIPDVPAYAAQWLGITPGAGSRTLLPTLAASEYEERLTGDHTSPRPPGFPAALWAAPWAELEVTASDGEGTYLWIGGHGCYPLAAGHAQVRFWAPVPPADWWTRLVDIAADGDRPALRESTRWRSLG